MASTSIDLRHLSPEAFAALGGPDLVYVRSVKLDELEGVSGTESLPPDAILYAVHAADGARMAVVDDRDLAFVAARQHEKLPVSVH